MVLYLLSGDDGLSCCGPGLDSGQAVADGAGVDGTVAVSGSDDTSGGGGGQTVSGSDDSSGGGSGVSGDADGGGGDSLVGDSDVGDGLGHGNGLDVGVGPLLNDWGLDDVLDLVDWVWLGDLDWDWDIDLVGDGDGPVDDDGPLNGGWHWDGHIDLVLVDRQVGDDLGPLWGDDGVGAAETDGGLVDDLVKGSGAQVAGWWGDGGSWGWHGDSWHGQGPVGHLVGGWAGDDGVCWWLVDGLAGNVVLVSDLDGLGTSLDGAGSDDSVLDVGAGDGWAGVHLLAHVAGAGGESSDTTDDGTVGSSGITDGWGGGDSSNCCVPGRSSRANSSAESSQNQKLNHDVVC